MAQNFPTATSAHLADRVLTNIVHGYVNADSIAPFVAPVVTVRERSGIVKKFDKSNFVMVDTRRAPGDIIKSVTTGFSGEFYRLEQHAIRGKVTVEEAQEALEGQANVDLRQESATRAAAAIALSWEGEVTGLITNDAIYEATNVQTLPATAQFDNPASDPEITIQEGKEAVRAQIGMYPNAMVMDVKTYNALKFNATFRDRIKFTNPGSVNLEMLKSWFDLPYGVKLSAKTKNDPVTGQLVDIMPAGKIVLFYHPDGGMNPGKLDAPGVVFKPVNSASRSKPSAWYTYQRANYPIARPERLDYETETYYTTVIAEQAIIPTGLGVNGLVGAAYLFNSVISGT